MPERGLVAGVDSSTQSCKVVVRDLATGARVRTAAVPHPAGTEVDPHHWEQALRTALEDAGGLADVAALSIAAQQHGLIALDETGATVRDALLWNDTRSAGAAADLLAELPGGAMEWARSVGSVPLASFTVTKLRWLADHEPDNAGRVAAVCLPHDWLTWRLTGAASLESLVTDRSDASGTAYWSPSAGEYRPDLVSLAFGRTPVLPRVLAPDAEAGHADHVLLGAGSGDNAGVALGLQLEPGDVVVSVGTSGVICTVAAVPTADGTGTVAGFADARGGFLPLVCTMNAARVLATTAELLGITPGELDDLALSAPAGAEGVVLVPYLEGERTPNRPHATAAFHGLSLTAATRANVARAAVEGLLCSLAEGMDALVGAGFPVARVVLVGGGARSEALRRIAPAVLGCPVTVPPPGEYAADGAARQAAWALTGVLPGWAPDPARVYDAPSTPHVRERYREAGQLTLDQAPGPDA